MNKFLFLFLLIFHLGHISTRNIISNKTIDKEKDHPRWFSYEVDPTAPNIVLIAGDEEYRSEEALPQLAKILSTHHGFNTIVLFSQDPELPGVINPNYSGNIPGLQNLEKADLMIIFTRFRSLPDDQMKYIDDYLRGGKPLMGIRTATHAFQFDRDSNSSYKHYSNSNEQVAGWKGGFGRVVLGEKWIAHWGEHRHQSTRGIVVKEAIGHPVLKGIESGDIWGPTDVYEVRLPLPEGSKTIVLGQVMDREKDYDEADLFYGMRPTDSVAAEKSIHRYQGGEKIIDHTATPEMPIAWIKEYRIPGGQDGIAFTTTMGSSTDILSEGFRRLLVNAVYWCLEMAVPDNIDVTIVGDYKPSQFGFHSDEYWMKKRIKISVPE